jgi:hypothetical protein
MEALGPGMATLSSDELIRQFPDAINEIIKACTEPQYEYERQLIINRARKNWQFYKGNHFPVPGLVDTPYGDVIDYTWLDGASASDENGANVRFMRPVNIIGGDGYKYVAVLGNSAPRVRAVSNNPANNESTVDSELAEACIRDAWIKLEIDRKWPALAFHQYVTGPAYIRTFFNTDARKYGSSTEPTIEQGMTPDGIPVPTPGQPKTYANGDVEIRVYSVLEIEHPFMAEELENCYFFKCEEMVPKWDALDQEEDKLGQYRETEVPDSDLSPASVAAAEARESSGAPSGLGHAKRPHLWRRREWWAQPSMFQSITSDTIRKQFKSQFPEGIYIRRYGDITTKVEARRLTDEWTVCKTGRGVRIYENAVCSDGLPLQQWINDAFNLVMETLLRSIPQTLVRSNLLDRESWSRKEPVPAEIILVPPGEGALENEIVQIPPTRVNDQTVPTITMVRGIMQDISQIRPELTGGGPLANTFREAKQRKDQALLGISPQAREMQYAAARVAENIVRMRAKYASGTITVPKKSSFGEESDVVDMSRLTDPGTTWHAESDDNFPMTLADRWDKMWALLKEFPPEVQKMLGIMDPLNLNQTLELLQLPDFESQLVDQRNKTLADINQLLQAQPIPAPPGPPGQPPGQPQPSIQPDAYDDHEFCSEFLARWLLSKTGQSTKQSNPNGFQNVELFQAAQFKLTQPPPPPKPPTVKAGFTVTAKPEDVGPQVMNELLQGAQLPGNTMGMPAISPVTAVNAAKTAAAGAKAEAAMPLPGADEAEAPIPDLSGMGTGAIQ